MFAANFAQLGDPDFDGVNDASSFDPVGGFGWNVPKWWGFVWGFGGGYTWPAARLGGAAPASNQTIDIPLALPADSGATGARITLMRPTGRLSTVVCPTSPCQVSADRRTGSLLMKLDYLNSSGKVVKSGQPIPLHVAPTLP